MLCVLFVIFSICVSFALLWPYWVWRRARSSASCKQQLWVGADLFASKIFHPVAAVHLSVVVPAYNEALRLPQMLSETLRYLKSRKFPSFEVIVVDDGSSDGTSEVARKFPGVHVVRLPVNQGKGAAVKTGVLHASGERILMVDADGATQFSEYAKLENLLSRVPVVFGSRAHLEASDAVARRSVLRNFLMKGFHMCVRLFVGSQVRDTQCGFKLFSRVAAQQLFPSLHLDRWAFDIELVELCRRLKLEIAEVPVNWHEVPGSKLHVISASIQMLRDMASVRLCYSLGLWTPLTALDTSAATK